ncbi:MAG: NUDIX hydrolase, partial [Trebonia sp.]
MQQEPPFSGYERVLAWHRFPTGYANKGERHEDTIAREVREETGFAVKAGRLLKVRSGFQYRIEIYYEAVLVGGLDDPGLT